MCFAKGFFDDAAVLEELQQDLREWMRREDGQSDAYGNEVNTIVIKSRWGCMKWREDGQYRQT